MSKILNVGSASAGNFTLKAKRGKTILYVECRKKDRVKVLKERLIEMLQFSMKDEIPFDIQLFKEAAKTDESEPTYANGNPSNSDLVPLVENIMLDTYEFRDGSTIFISFCNEGVFEDVHYDIPALPAPESDASDDDCEKSASKMD